MLRRTYFFGVLAAMTMQLCALDNPEYYFILKPSTIADGGIGVFAAQDLPAGTGVFKRRVAETRKMKVQDIPKPFLQYCVYEGEDECWAPESFDKMLISWYLNHSHTPNIAHFASRDPNFYFRTLRDIKEGEEIFMDYNSLNEPEARKEDYYKKNE